MLPRFWEAYFKHIESFLKKGEKEEEKRLGNIPYSKEYCKFDEERNLKLFDVLCAKLTEKPFTLRPNNPGKNIAENRERFVGMKPEEQAVILKNMIQLFGPSGRGGVDLKKIGLKDKTGSVKPSSNLSNWSYSDIRIIYTDASGLHEMKSINLKELCKEEMIQDSLI